MDSRDAPVVLTQNLTKTFRSVTALDRLNLRVGRGEVLALLGANGSGKSTTFRLLLNIYRPTSGRASLLGRDCSRLDGADFDKIAYVSEGQKLPLWMTIGGHNAWCAKFYIEWDSGFCDRLLEGFQLNPDQRIKHLSRGQRMKAALASTLPARPRVLLLDEPFSGLDVETRAQLSDLLQKLARENDLTTILTTHDVEEVEPVASRLVILNRGRAQTDEDLAAFLVRHRRLRIRGLNGGAPPKWPARIFARREGENELELLTDDFDPGRETALRDALPPGAELQIEPLRLREILAGRALKL